jgi:predicted transcriptional regulator
MRRRTTPIGWPGRDPRRYRFAVPNAVWKCKLKPVEFVIFSYLCYHSTPGVLTPEIIAADVHITAGTVKKYLTTLISKGIVSEDGTPALECTDEKFFTLPNGVFLLRLPPSAFLVYAYLLLIEDRRTHTCHPSYNTIAAATGISKNTTMKSIGELLEMELITVESSSYFDKHGLKWKGNNLYTILPVRAAVDAFYRRQLHQLELDAERRRVLRRQAEYDRHHSRAALCAPASTRTTPDPLQQAHAPVRPLKAVYEGTKV